MKRMWTRMWSRKWLIAVGTMVIFLSIGAVAWAAAGGGEAPAPSWGVATQPAGEPAVITLAYAEDESSAALEGKPLLNKQALREKKEVLTEKRQRWLQGQKTFMNLLREKMTPEDQAAYDRLAQTAKDQLAALQEARENLAETKKELRELTDKYIDEAADAKLGAGTTGAAPASTTLQ